MTLESLKEYKSKKEEIAELAYKLEHLPSDLVGNSTVFDYRSGYPKAQAVVGTDRERFYRLNAQWSKKKKQLEDECSQVEDFIEGIPDSLTRRVFRQRFIEGRTQEQISKSTHISQSSISKKIGSFFKME